MSNDQAKLERAKSGRHECIRFFPDTLWIECNEVVLEIRAREVIAMVLRGRVHNGVIILENSAPALPEGSLVQVTPLQDSLPSVSREDVGELETVEAGRRPRPVDPFSEPGVAPPSEQRQQALLGLIGICKTDNPPDDEEVERIIEEYRMEKYA